MYYKRKNGKVFKKVIEGIYTTVHLYDFKYGIITEDINDVTKEDYDVCTQQEFYDAYKAVLGKLTL